jgi:hypothetical protein
MRRAFMHPDNSSPVLTGCLSKDALCPESLLGRLKNNRKYISKVMQSVRQVLGRTIVLDVGGGTGWWKGVKNKVVHGAYAV